MEERKYRVCRKCKEVWNVSAVVKGEWHYVCPICEYGNKWVKRFCMRCFYGKENIAYT